MDFVTWCALLVAFGKLVTSVESEVDEPMVAFVCNRPAMYATNRGWTPDDTTSCIKDPVDVLNYCRKVYPERDVWNVVEASEMVTIRNWCNFGHTKCRHRFTVRPFRCLVGAFQSEALQVPDQCVFDHVHGAGSKDCQSSAAWNLTAHQACVDRHGSSQPHLHGFAVLQPCGIDGFGGVEFVCCPAPSSSTPTTASTTASNEMTSSTTRRHHVRRTSTVSSAASVAQVTRTVTTATASSIHNKPTTATTPRPAPTSAAAEFHLQTGALKSLKATEQLADDDDDEDWRKLEESDSDDGSLTEHDRFAKLKAQLEKRHHEKVAKMMKEWAAARRRVQEIKHIDARGGEKFNREMTARFQKAYESLERETAAERKKLLVEHQRRIQDDLSRKKSQAMDTYMSAVNAPNADATKVLKALEQYVRAEQKDRVHTIQHYKQVEESDPVEAESQRAAVSSHLRGIDERVTQAIDMLNRLPKFEKKIRQQIERFLSRYQSLDESLAVIMAKINEQTNGNRVQARPHWSRDLTVEQPAFTTPSAGTTGSSDIERQSTGLLSLGVETTTTMPSIAWETVSEHLTTTENEFDASTTSRVEEDVGKTQDKPLVLVDHISAVAHNQKNDLVVLESYIRKSPVRTESVGHLAAPLAIVACGFAVFVVVAVGVAVVRRRLAMTGDVIAGSSAAGPAGTVTEVDRAAAAQLAATKGNLIDPRLAINGYENPTYQFYVAAEAEAARKAASVADLDDA